MNLREVVEVHWLNTDLTGTKPRPAIVVQANYLNTLVDDTTYLKVARKRNPLQTPSCSFRLQVGLRHRIFSTRRNCAQERPIVFRAADAESCVAGALKPLSSLQ